MLGSGGIDNERLKNSVLTGCFFVQVAYLPQPPVPHGLPTRFNRFFTQLCCFFAVSHSEIRRKKPFSTKFCVYRINFSLSHFTEKKFFLSVVIKKKKMLVSMQPFVPLLLWDTQ